MPPRVFELAGYWIGREPGRDALYCYWYDTGTGRVRRRTLGTEDIESAKLKLAEIATQGTAARTTRQPGDVTIVSVLDHYLTHKVPGQANPYNARRACQLLAQYLFDARKLKPTVRCNAMTLALQQDFMQWCAAEHGHNAAGIERNMVAIRAAFNYAAQGQIVTVDGVRREVRLLDHAPTIKTNQRWIAQHTGAQHGAPRDWIPSLEQLASLLDFPAPDYLQRYDILALNTWARPEAIWDLNTHKQVDEATGLLDLNPPGRKQTNKFRPTIRLTDGLAQWIRVWGKAYPLRGSSSTFTGCRTATAVETAFRRRTDRWRMTQAGYSEADINRIEGLTHPRHAHLTKEERWGPYNEAMARADELGIGQVTQYTLRHFMATRVRALEDIRVGVEQRSAWLGHSRGDTTSWYESFDPEFLRECALATERVICMLDDLTERRLVPKSVRDKGLKVVGGRDA